MSFITPAAAATRARSPILTWSAMPARPPNWTPSPATTLPEMPVCAASRQLRPRRTLWATWTRLSILVFSPITVSSHAPRSMQVQAPIETLSWMITRPSWGTSTVLPWPTVTPKPGSPITAPDRMLTRSPSREKPRVTCEPIVQPRPMATPGPITL